MVEVTMAQNQSVEGGSVDGQEIDVVVERLRREAKIHQKIADLIAALRLCMHRQTELANERSDRRLVLAEAPAEVLDVDGTHFLARRNGELVTVDYDTNRDCVDFGNCAVDRLRAHRL